MEHVNYLVKYFEKRAQAGALYTQNEPGPVITISREYGCNAKEIAQKTIEIINSNFEENNKWRWISKEALKETARELQVDPEYVSHVFEGKSKKMGEDIIESFVNNHYASDSYIISTIEKVIRSYAFAGKVLIIGRGGCAIAKDIKKSLHIKLIAPIKWRENEVMRRFNLNLKEAEKAIKENDASREAFLKMICKSNKECDSFDSVFNCAKFSSEQIAHAIADLAKIKNLI